MYPYDVQLFGTQVSIWNFTLIIAVVAGYPLLLAAFRLRRTAPLPRLLPLRWLATVYISAVGAQLFAYLFDTYTTVQPPQTVSWARYYLDPLFSSKTLYGAVVLLPFTALIISLPWGDLGYDEALDCWTPPMFGVLAIARIGCLLQGCCYGIRSDLFGVSFPPHGELYYGQLRAGLIERGATASLPVIPTQAVSALALFALCAWAFRELRRGRRRIFPAGVALYSVFRFFVEIVRDDVARNFLGPLSTSQWIALLVVVAYGAWKLRFGGRAVPA